MKPDEFKNLIKNIAAIVSLGDNRFSLSDGSKIVTVVVDDEEVDEVET